MYVAMGTCMAGACGWLVCSFAPMAAGSGLAQLKTILGGFIIRKFLGGWTLLVKSIGLVLSVSSALVAGKEGPMVHIACCWGNLISRCFSKYSWNEAKKREIVSSSAAAGIAVAFGAPIGGVLYSLEELSSYFPHKTMLRAFFCAIAAKLIYIYINPLPTGKSVQFAVQSKLNEWEWFDMFFFILLGVLGGVVGAFFVKFNLRIYKLRQSRQWLRSNPLRQVVGVAFVTCVLSYFNVFMRDNMLQLLEHLFSRCDPSIDVDDLDGVTAALCRRDNDGLQIFSLILAGVLKMVLLVFTFGLMVPVGLFIPSLASGACLGRALGMSILLWHESVGTSFPFTACVGRSPTLCVSPRVYAIVGAAGMLAGVMRITVSLVVIMLEVTGGLEYVLPVMIAVTVAKWVGDAISGEGISGSAMALSCSRAFFLSLTRPLPHQTPCRAPTATRSSTPRPRSTARARPPTS
jgi:chloride channel 3/4/5